MVIPSTQFAWPVERPGECVLAVKNRRGFLVDQAACLEYFGIEFGDWATTVERYKDRYYTVAISAAADRTVYELLVNEEMAVYYESNLGGQYQK